MATLNTQKWIDYYSSDREKKKETAAAGYDAQKANLTNAYASQIDEAETSYEDSYRENEVQKLINERQVAENMANLGLTSSGLNRTQSTAVQLSYANAKASIDRQKRSMVDGLTRELTAYLAEIDAEKATALRDIDDNYSQLAAQSAQNEYEAELEAETAQVKAYYSMQTEVAKQQIRSAASSAGETGTIARLAYGTLANTKYTSNGNVIYTDTGGNTAVMRRGANPFTGTVNTDLYDSEGKYDPSNAFSNGYQPNNIGGKTLTAVADVRIEVNGNRQCVWKKEKSNEYYYWDGTVNRYFKMTAAELSDLGIVRKKK